MMIVNLVKLIIAVFKNRRQLNVYYFYPIVVYIAVICAPIGTWEDYLSPVKFRACYEGTQNQAYILFRNDNSFELHWTGVFFYSKWYSGKWQQKNNIILLKYQTDPVEVLGGSVLMKDGYLVPLDNSVEAGFKQYPMFYLGYCKGEN